jgi:hypothetical protein
MSGGKSEEGLAAAGKLRGNPQLSLTLNFIFGWLCGCESAMRETRDQILDRAFSDS